MSTFFNKVEAKIKSFEQAFIPNKESIVLPKLKSILLALDAHSWAIESSKYSMDVASELSIKHGAFVQVVCMAVSDEEYEKSEKLVSEAVKSLESNNVSCSGLCIVGSPSKNILSLIESESHDLVFYLVLMLKGLRKITLRVWVPLLRFY